MKVWEALELLNSLDKTMDVTLIFGGSINTPKYNGPSYTGAPAWIAKDSFTPPFTVTCKSTEYIQ